MSEDAERFGGLSAAAAGAAAEPPPGAAAAAAITPSMKDLSVKEG